MEETTIPFECPDCGDRFELRYTETGGGGIVYLSIPQHWCEHDVRALCEAAVARYEQEDAASLSEHRCWTEDI